MQFEEGGFSFAIFDATWSCIQPDIHVTAVKLLINNSFKAIGFEKIFLLELFLVKKFATWENMK